MSLSMMSFILVLKRALLLHHVSKLWRYLFQKPENQEPKSQNEKESEPMFDTLFIALKDEVNAAGHMTGVIGGIYHLVDLVGLDYVKDQDAKNAAIDAICEILQAHKNKQVTNAQEPTTTV